MARESKNGGSVKSNAAAIQSSGRRGMLVSLLIGLLLLLMLATGRGAALPGPGRSARRPPSPGGCSAPTLPKPDSKRAGSGENAFVQGREKFRCLEGEGHKAA